MYVMSANSARCNTNVLRYQVLNASLIRNRPFPPLVFDHLQYAKTYTINQKQGLQRAKRKNKNDNNKKHAARIHKHMLQAIS